MKSYVRDAALIDCIARSIALEDILTSYISSKEENSVVCDLMMSYFDMHNQALRSLPLELHDRIYSDELGQLLVENSKKIQGYHDRYKKLKADL